MKYILSLFLLAASSLVVSRFAPAPTPLAPLSIGGEEDREAMAHEEFLRLRNPQTNMIPEGIKEREHDFVEALAVNTLTKGWSAASGDTEIHLDESQLVQHGIERTGGRTRSLVFDCTNSSVMLAGAVGGGVWRSTNGGVTWKKTTSDGYIHSVSALVQDGRPGHQHEWYYGSGEGYSSGGYPIYGYDIGIGIFKSIDSGKSWSLLPSTSVARASRPGSPFHLTHNLALDHTRKDSTIVYAACNGAVMRSNDAGVTWSAVLGDTSATTVVWSDVTVASNGVVYASLGSSSKSGIWRSADGVTWTNISTGTAVGTINSRTRVVTAPSNPNVLWVYKNSANTPLFRYQYVSGNGSGTGGEWESRSSTMTGLLQTQSGYNMCLAVHPTNENIVLVGGTNLYLTTDGFMTIPRINHVSGYSKSYVQNRQWNPFTPETYLYDTSHPDMHAAVFAPNDSTTVFIGCDGGVFKTTNIFKDSVVRWSSLNNGYNVGQFYSTAIDPSGIRDGAVIGGAQDNNSNIGLRNGKPMEWVLGGDGMVCEMSAGHKAVYPSYQGGQVYRVRMNETLDSALEWVNMRPRGGQFDFTAPLRLHPVSDSILYMIGGASLWVNWNATQRAYTNDTTTSSQNWRSYPMSAYATGGLSAMGLCTSSPNTVYLGTKSGVVLKVDSLQRTSAIVKTVTGTDMPKGAYVSLSLIHI